MNSTVLISLQVFTEYFAPDRLVTVLKFYPIIESLQSIN